MSAQLGLAMPSVSPPPQHHKPYPGAAMSLSSVDAPT